VHAKEYIYYKNSYLYYNIKEKSQAPYGDEGAQEKLAMYA
jgi:hypothetical protein